MKDFDHRCPGCSPEPVSYFTEDIEAEVGDAPKCPMCAGPGESLGTLGRLAWWRCPACHWQWPVTLPLKGKERTMCDLCLTAGYDEGWPEDMVEQLLGELGADIADHCCEVTEGNVEACACACQSR